MFKTALLHSPKKISYPRAKLCVSMYNNGGNSFQMKKDHSSLTSCPNLFKIGKKKYPWRVGSADWEKQVPIRGGKEKRGLECQNKLSFWQGFIGNRSTSLFHARKSSMKALCTVPLFNLRHLDAGFCFSILTEGQEEINIARKHTVDLQQVIEMFMFILNHTKFWMVFFIILLLIATSTSCYPLHLTKLHHPN